MAVEMPDQVVAAGGAAAVEFPWARASDAVDALNRAVAALTSQIRARARMEGTLGDWQGRFRGDFDDGYGDMVDAAATLADDLAARAGGVVAGADAANDEQVRRNRAATAGGPG
jgi:hypothetical protein